MRRLFDPHPIAMARIPLRAAYELAEGDGGLLDEGILLASRSAEQASETDRGRTTRHGYDLRSRSRTTPHGVFAGVAPATLTGSRTTLKMGSAHRTVTTPSPIWLTAVAAQLLCEEPDLLSTLTLTTASLTTERGDRLETECPASEGTQTSRVRATTVSRWLLEAGRGGAPAAEVLRELLRRHPGADEPMARRAVLAMIDTGLLLTDLLPDDLRADPLQHLLNKLPPTADARTTVERLARLLARSDTHVPGSMPRRTLLKEARELADQLHKTDRPLTVDTLADAQIALPSKVGEQAALAASLLWRIGHRTGPLTDYHARFRNTYGHNRLVPLPEVLDPVVGLGPPNATDGLGAEEAPRRHRTTTLTHLLSNALTAGKDEVELREEHIEQLANPASLPPPRSAEIHLQLLRAASGARVAVHPGTGSQTAGAAPGRWARWLRQLVPHEPADTGNGLMIAEIVCRPCTATAGTLAAETGAAPWRIPLDTPTRDGDLLLHELALSTTGSHLQLWSTRHRRPVLPTLYNRLTRHHLPPAAYFLYLLGQAGTRPWHPWNWAPLENWPYTPRVRYRDILLAPARWRLPEELTTAAGNRTTFAEQLAAWRTGARPTPPPVLVAEEADRRLPLDLRQEDHRELLRRSIHRGTRFLAEPAAAPEELAVVDGPKGARHLIDLVVPLARRHEPRHPQRDPRAAGRAPGAGIHLPGSSWLSAALTVPTYLHDAALLALAPLLTDLPEEVERWFWLRYTTPALGPHLRVRLHGAPHTLAADVQPRLTRLVQQLQDVRLLRPGALYLEPYEQEIERYGGDRAITAAEEVFCADSDFALAAIPCADDERLLAAAVGAADIARTLAPAEPRSALRPGRLTSEQRTHRDVLRPRLSESPLSRHLATVHEARHTALLAYRATLSEEFASRCANDVIHMHANRMLGTDLAHERIMRTLAADLLHRP